VNRDLCNFFEIEAPFYYSESQPLPSDQIHQVGALCRVASFLNAVHRVKTLTTFCTFDAANNQNILLLDSKYLLLKNQWVAPQFCASQPMQNIPGASTGNAF
jgi:hypothetical protein